jgi:hypothetical protein
MHCNPGQYIFKLGRWIVKGRRIEYAVVLGAFYGLRRSEIVSLKWYAIDSKRKTGR